MNFAENYSPSQKKDFSPPKREDFLTEKFEKIVPLGVKFIDNVKGELERRLGFSEPTERKNRTRIPVKCLKGKTHKEKITKIINYEKAGFGLRITEEPENSTHAKYKFFCYGNIKTLDPKYLEYPAIIQDIIKEGQ